MNKYLAHIEAGVVDAPNLADWLIAHGIASISTEDAAHLLGVPNNHVRQRLAAQRKKGSIASPSRGFWIPVPAEYRTWGAPEPVAYLDDMMNYLDARYCVGWLSAAALHGASHHAAQVFQVATSKQLRQKTVGRSELHFFERDYLDEITVETKSFPHGRMRVASIATTMLMVCDDVELCGGIDNVANVIIELFEDAENKNVVIDGIRRSLHLFSSAAGRRLGWILEEFTDCADVDDIAAQCVARNRSLSILSPQSPRGGTANKRWHLEINRKVEPDV